MKPTLFDAKHLLEKLTLVFPFGLELPTSVTIASVQTSVITKRGTDAAPASVLLGLPSIQPNGEVLQRVQGGVAGAAYLFVVAATLSNGNVLVRAGELPVIDFI